MQKYNNLQDMLDRCPGAKKYYNDLPDYVQEMICQRGDNVCTEETLKNYADNLLSGDK